MLSDIEIFKSGKLVMPVVPPTFEETAVLWGDCLANRIMVVVSVGLLLAMLGETLQLMPSILYCIRMARGSVNMEHSISQARARNILAAAYFLPFCLMADRLELCCPKSFPQLNGALKVAAVLLSYLLVRLIIFKLSIPGKKSAKDSSMAAHRAIFTFFIALTILMLASLGLISVFNAGTDVMRNVALYEIAAFYLLSIIRTSQILKAEYSGVRTFLYLCALEFLPLGLLIYRALHL